MSSPTFFTDEDVYGAIASSLRRVGIDAISTPEVDRLGESDDSQLEWATSQGRVLVVSRQNPVGELLRRLARLAEKRASLDMRDRLEYLSSW